jgi:1-deoxy-D-xylulose-5-phosphate synthase
MMYTAQLDGMGPFAIRYPRGRGVMPVWKTPFTALEVGKGRIIREGKDLAIISLGHTGNEALNACIQLEGKNIDAALYDMRFLKPIDEELLHLIFSQFDKIITLEDASIIGGLGSAVNEFANDNGYHKAAIHRLGIPDRFVEQGTVEELHHQCGIDSDAIVSAAEQFMVLK